MRYSLHYSTSLSTAIFLGCSISIASGEVKPKVFDLSGDNYLNAQEYAAYTLHRTSAVYRALDKNKDGIIKPAELEEYKTEARGTANREAHDDLIEIPGFDGKKPVYVKELERVHLEHKPATFAEGEPKKSTDGNKVFQAGGLLLREKHEDIGVLDNAVAFKRAKAANFSFVKDLKDHTTLTSAKGSIIFPLRTRFPNAKPSSKNSQLIEYVTVPSVTFDYFKNPAKPKTDRDALAFRLGGEWNFGGGLFDSQYFRANAVYHTNFDFETGIVAGEAQWEPVIPELGIGYPNEEGFLGFQSRVIAHIEGGKIVDNGGNPDLATDRNFVRVGPKLELNVWIPETGLSENMRWLSNFTAKAGYQHLFELTGNSQDSYDLTAELDYLLNKAGNAAIGIDYRFGRVPLVLDKTHELKFGLKIKF
ncbi:MAG: hypothetical protein GY761_03865 [Hyphomicrobiales bacterium]|nr:hypothetical protein [Hyphomicrobiales bacterium]